MGTGGIYNRPVATLDLVAARRLALARAGLLKPEWTGLSLTSGRGQRQARAAAHRVVGRFGYLQLDSVAVAGARTHGLVLLARLTRFPAALAEALLAPGEPLFEYWGHEASWLPMELWPAFAFRRREFAVHPWWGDLLGHHPEVADELLARLDAEGPLRSSELDDHRPSAMWDIGVVKKVASALWSRGDIAVRERSGFQRRWDLTERVIPETVRRQSMAPDEALRQLVLKALDGHGWATTSTVVATWRLQRRRSEVEAALAELRAADLVRSCTLLDAGGNRHRGWARPADLELAEALRTCRPRASTGVLLSPFDPLLWDRARVRLLFDFEQVLEIYKPPATRRWGYYCLPVLAGDRLVGRVDLKADRHRGRLLVLARHREEGGSPAPTESAITSAIDRLARQLELEPAGPRRQP